MSKRWYKNNKEKRLKQIKEYVNKNKEFFKEYRSKWVEENRDRVNESYNNNRLKNPEKFREKSRKYYKENKKTMNIKRVFRKTGISQEQYDLMIKNQDNKCAICKKAPYKNKKLFIDHCHSTGNIRGLLCNSCNSGLGFFKDNCDFMLFAIEYLKSPPFYNLKEEDINAVNL